MTVGITDESTGSTVYVAADESGILLTMSAEPTAPIRAIIPGQFEWLPEIAGAECTRVSLVRALYAWGATYREIGEMFGVSRERVRQILNREVGDDIQSIRAERLVNLETLESRAARSNAELIARWLEAHGPGTVTKLAEVLGLTEDQVRRAWPDRLAHFKLAHLKQNHQRTWNEGQILGALRQASLYEFPLARKKYDAMLQVGQVQGPSGARVEQVFGTWSAACKAAGVESGAPRRAPYESRWTDEELIGFVRDYLKTPAYGGTFAGYDKWRKATGTDAPGSGTLRNRLGTWSDLKRRTLETMWGEDE